MFVHKNFPEIVNTKILHLITMYVPGLKFSWISPFSFNTKILPLLTMTNLPPSLTRIFEIRGG